MTWAPRISVHAGAAMTLAMVCIAAPGNALAQQAGFRGRVLEDGSERPIAGARVELRELGLGVMTDSTGAFRIAAVRPGSQRVIVRAVGFDSVATTVRFSPSETVDSDFLMAPVATRLAAVKVEARLTGLDELRLREFEERRRMGFGRFLDRSYFERNAGRRLSELLMSGGAHFEFDLDAILADEIIGFEYYTVASAPLRFSGSALDREGGSACGTAVIWTK